MSTIVGIATAPGIGGIGIIRMSGEKTFEILDKIFIPKTKQDISEIKGYSIKYGNVVENNKIIDEVLVSYFKTPKSYTTENMCEINAHGGNIVVKKILELCLANGAEMAGPGEFTKRAFLNGRIDLAQAESVIDVINAKSEREAKSGIKQLEGFLSTEINQIKQDILDVLVNIEVTIDYPEYDTPEVQENELKNMLNKVENKLEKLEKSFDNGKIIKDGIKTAIIGKPNAGKSSLLNAILKEIEEGTLLFDPEAEDIHMFVESELTKRYPVAGKKLHTGRSRNDQVALDLRLYAHDEILEIKKMLVNLIHTLTDLAEHNLDTIMPGYTHLQRAQPITFAHHLMAYASMFLRDIDRLEDVDKRLYVSPLGSGALATTTYPLDRPFVAEELGMYDIMYNSLDGVSDRDYAIELSSALATIMMHLSRFSEEVILWCSWEFKFIDLDDAGIGSRYLDVGWPFIMQFVDFNHETEEMNYRFDLAQNFLRGYFGEGKISRKEYDLIFQGAIQMHISYMQVYGPYAVDSLWKILLFGIEQKEQLWKMIQRNNC